MIAGSGSRRCGNRVAGAVPVVLVGLAVGPAAADLPDTAACGANCCLVRVRADPADGQVRNSIEIMREAGYDQRAVLSVRNGSAGSFEQMAVLDLADRKVLQYRLLPGSGADRVIRVQGLWKPPDTDNWRPHWDVRTESDDGSGPEARDVVARCGFDEAEGTDGDYNDLIVTIRQTPE